MRWQDHIVVPLSLSISAIEQSSSCNSTRPRPLTSPLKLRGLDVLAQVQWWLQWCGRLNVLEPVQEARPCQHKVAAAPAAVTRIPQIHGALHSNTAGTLVKDHHSCLVFERLRAGLNYQH